MCPADRSPRCLPARSPTRCCTTCGGRSTSFACTRWPTGGCPAGRSWSATTAVDVLGAEQVAGAVPLMQPLAMARTTRTRLGGRRGLLSELRDRVVARADVQPDETIRIERLRPLSLLTGVGAVAAVYLVGTQLTDVPFATASVAANQVGNVAVSIPLIVVLGLATGSSVAASLEPSPTMLAVIGAIVLLAGLLLLVAPIRARALAIWKDFVQRGLPRLLDVLANPRKLAEAVGGIVLQATALVFCFYACLQAMGANVNVAALAVVQLVGNTVGTAVPTPGGLGAVEAALTAGLA